MQYYPLHSNLENSSKLISKKEFTDKDTKIYQEPHQIFLRNYISKQTIYDNILIYHSMGSGKTCSAISISEGFKEYIYNLKRHIIVLVKNKNIERNFRAELLSQCTDDTYLTQEEREILNSKDSSERKRSLKNRLTKDINKHYQFITYGTFVNRVLGSKEYEKDEFGNNTNVVVRKNGQIVRKLSKDKITNLNNSVIIVDEAHNITNTDTYHALHKILKNSTNTRLVLLTATPIFDNIKEIFELTNLLNIKAELPIRNELFKTEPLYAEKVKSNFINENVLKGGISSITDYGYEQIKKFLQGKVSHVQTNLNTFPTRIDIGEPITNREGSVKVVLCNMSKYQYDIYTQAFKDDTGIENSSDTEVVDIDYDKDPEYDFDELNIQNMEVVEKSQKTSSLYKNSSDASTMVYPENLYGKAGYQSFFIKQQGRLKPKDPKVLHVDGTLKLYSSKLHTLMTNVKKSEGLVFIFSHFVTNGGTSLLSHVLSANGYSEYKGGTSSTNNSFVVFDDKMSSEQKERIRRLFNSPENSNGAIIKIIVGSPVMSEGITLKRVRQVHILEPYWNLSRVEQVIGRAIRNYSHYDLPKHQQNVEVYKYVSIYNPEEMSSNIDEKSIDFYIDKEKYILSEEKDRSNKKVERILKKMSIDCVFNMERNQLDISNNMSPQCDYTECNYECDIPRLEKEDVTTYNYYLQTIASYQIGSSTDLISEAFRTQFVWNLNDLILFLRKKYPFMSNEAIYTSLTSMVNDKVIIKDSLDRDGFIIQRGPYYIFNSENIDVKSSFFSKFLDFSTYYSKTNINNYIFDKYKLNILTDTKQVDQEQVDKEQVDKVDKVDKLDKEKKQKEISTEKVLLSKELLRYNEDIINNNIIYGTFYTRPQKEDEVSLRDKKFRIVDKREFAESEDKRKIVTGMVCTSYSKGDLIKLVEFLNIKHSENLQKLDKVTLCKMIEDHFDQNNMLLK